MSDKPRPQVVEVVQKRPKLKPRQPEPGNSMSYPGAPLSGAAPSECEHESSKHSSPAFCIWCLETL